MKDPKETPEKSGQPKKKKEGNFYDKIIKENLLEIFMPLVEAHLNIKVKRIQQLPEKEQTTIERETDSLMLIEPVVGIPFILHLEFQTSNNKNMIYRVGEYHGMNLRTYKLEIKHFVFYLGKNKSTMKSQLEPHEVYNGFHLINVCELDYTRNLSSQVPGEIIMAILGNYPRNQAEAVIRLILIQLRSVCKNPNDLSRYTKQLTILSRLRKLQNVTKKIATSMPILIDVNTDDFYLEGKAEGKAEGKEEGREEVMEKVRKAVIALHRDEGFSEEKIAKTLELTIEEVKEIIKNLK